MAQFASLHQYISAGNIVPSLVFPRCMQQSKKGNAARNLPRFAYLLGHCLLIFHSWGGNGNT
jgi:hypothetical protein